MFTAAYVEPYIHEYEWELMRWGVSVVYFGVSEEWINQLRDLWLGGEHISVAFLYRGQWCEGQAFIVSANISAMFAGQQLSLELVGTRELKRGRINGTTL